jgi:hypothetical protein
MRHRATVRRRFAPAALAALFVLGLAGRGVCAMRASASEDEHGCCRRGLQAAVASCCLDAPSRVAPARVSAVATGLLPLVPAALLDPVPNPAWRPAAPDVLSPTHAPPRSPTVLRI